MMKKDKIQFQTEPEKDSGYRENFQEYDNRGRAFSSTVKVLVIIAAATSAFVVFYLGKVKNIFPARKADQEVITIFETGEEEAAKAESELNAADAGRQEGQTQK